MPTIIDRLLGRAEPAEKAIVTGNGGTGLGVLAYMNDVPLWTAARNPRRLIKQAQELYHSHPWVHAAENVVSSRAAGVGWHLEDDQGEEVTDESAPELKAIRDLFEKPQTTLPPGIKRIYRRALWQVTLRHEGLCGTTFWYLDQREGLTGTPAAFLYINPARMYAVYDKAYNTIGWKLDADEDGNGGVPLELDEIVQFDYDPPDAGAYGIGIVESAGLKAHLSTVTDRHMGNVIGSGGRLAGIFAPKDANSTISPDDWAAFVRDFRNVNEDPNAAKRGQIVKAPIEHIRTAATPQELSIEAIAKMSRDDVTSLWGVPLSQLGVEQPAGLNSGSTKSYDEAVLWQGAIHSRLVPFKETIQYGILDRIAERGGPSLQLVIEEPEFDDETPQYDRAQKAISLPLRNRERREMLGLEPFGDPLLDEAVWLPVNIVEMALAPDEKGVTPVAPEPETPEPPVVPSDGEVVEVDALKARTEPLRGLRRSLDTRWEPKVRKAVQAVLRTQAVEIAKRVRERGAHLASKPSDTTVWWNEKKATEAMLRAIAPHSAGIAEQVAEGVKETIGKPAKADTFAESVADLVRKSVGERITKINETTRDDIAAIIAKGFDDGLSPAEIGDLIEGATAFDEARAELISRTETALAYNESALRSYTEFGVTQVQAIDGDQDEECAARDGQTFSLEEALSITDHPNGTLDWAPVV